jgi:hypothetical protein
VRRGAWRCAPCALTPNSQRLTQTHNATTHNRRTTHDTHDTQHATHTQVEFQGWTLGLGLLGCAACAALYTKDVTISYALGASAGLTYLRLLGRSVDAGAGRVCACVRVRAPV